MDRINFKAAMENNVAEELTYWINTRGFSAAEAKKRIKLSSCASEVVIDRMLVRHYTQEVTESEFDEMLCCLPPVETGKTRGEFIDIVQPVESYFLVGEPMSHVKGLPVYECYFQSLNKFWKFGYCLPVIT